MSLARVPRPLRRLITFPAPFVLLAGALATAPLWIPVLALVDLVSGRTYALRCGLFLVYHLVCESVGLLGCVVIWVLGLATGWESRPYRQACKWIQARWTGALLRGVAWVFELTFDVAGDEVARPGPLLMICRHVSTGDTIFSPWVMAGRHDFRLRYVLKSELAWDPCLDVSCSRSGSYFVTRSPVDREAETEAVGALIDDLADDEAVVIWPEGTRFTPAKRERVIAALEREGDPGTLALARKLRHMLPPRWGGVGALLERNPGADVLLVMHTGWEGAATIGDLWRGEVVGRTIRFRYRRCAYADLPRDRHGLEAWLADRWVEMDRWVEEQSR